MEKKSIVQTKRGEPINPILLMNKIRTLSVDCPQQGYKFINSSSHTF